MGEELRNKLIAVLLSDAYEAADLRDDILYGRNYPGLLNMTDEELVEEYGSYINDDDEFLVECKAALAIDKLLTE